MASNRKRRPSRLIGLLILLILIALMLPLSAFLAGFFSGGGRLDSPERQLDATQPSGTLAVTVVRAEDREPVAGARIEVRGLAGGGREVTTGADGRVELTGLGDGPVHLAVAAGSRRAAAWADPALRDRIQLSVTPDAQRTGTVRYADDTPAGGARVLLLGDAPEPLAETKADEAGRYVLPDHARARAVCAIAARGAPTLARGGDIVIAEGERIDGKLEGARAGTLEVFVRLDVPHGDLDVPVRFAWPVAADGTFAGRLPAAADAWGRFNGAPVRVRSGTIALPGGAPFSGRVEHADGTPASRAVLILRAQLDADFATPLPALQVDADADGAFAAADVPQVRYTVEVRAPGCATRTFAGVSPSPTPHKFVLAPGFVVRGFVVDSDGLPLPDARVQAIGMPSGEGDHPIADQQADAQGRFHLEGLAGRHARVRVTAPGHFPTTLERVAPDAALRVVLQRR